MWIKKIPYLKKCILYLLDKWRLVKLYPLYFTDKNRFGYLINERRYFKACGKKAVIDYYPSSITVYITFKCNFRCDGCTYLLKDEDVFDDGGFMEYADFENIANKYAGKIKYLMFSGGEATLHPRFTDMARLAHELGYTLNIATNGSNLMNVKDVLKHFNKINISMDSHDYPTFNKNRGATEKVYKKILEGLEWMGKNSVPFRFSYVLSKSRLPEADKFIEFSKMYKPNQLLFHSLIPHKSSSDEVLKIGDAEVREFYKKMLEQKDLPFNISMPFPVPDNENTFKNAICPKMWGTVYIHEKGDIAYCCQLKPEPSIGNVFNGYDLNSPKMVEFRQKMIDGVYPEEDCLLCQQRFELVEQNAKYEASLNRWSYIPSYLSDQIN